MIKKSIVFFLFVTMIMSFALATYAKGTMSPIPSLDQIDSYRVDYSDAYIELFDLTSSNLDELMGNSDAIVLAKTEDTGIPKAFSIQKEIQIVKCLKGDLSDTAILYEPVRIFWDNSLVSYMGYLPMIKGHTYLLFLRKNENIQGHKEIYYPVAGDIGKFEEGKRASMSLIETPYEQAKENACYVYDDTFFKYTGQERIDIYNRIYEEIMERDLFHYTQGHN